MPRNLELSFWQNALLHHDRRECTLVVVSTAHHRIDKYKLTGDPENPTSPVFPFLPGSPFMEKQKQKSKEGLKCSLLRLNDKSIADKKSSLESRVQFCKQCKHTELYF